MAQNDQDPELGNPSDFSEETNPNIDNLVKATKEAAQAKSDGNSTSLEALTKAKTEGPKSSTSFKPFGKPAFGVAPSKSP